MVGVTLSAVRLRLITYAPNSVNQGAKNDFLTHRFPHVHNPYSEVLPPPVPGRKRLSQLGISVIILT
jgi:hypothetical protein